jgi:hypothetical protein
MLEYKLIAVDPSLCNQIPLEKFATYTVCTESRNDFVTHYDGRLIGGNIIVNGCKYWVHAPEDKGFVVKRVYPSNENETDPVLREWGYGEDIIREIADHQLHQFLRVQVASFRDSSLHFRVLRRLAVFTPFRSEMYAGKITVIKSRKDFDVDRKVAMKPGRAISLMFPELEHKQIIQITDAYLQKFAKRDFTIHVGDDEDDFTLAYSGTQSQTENIETTYSRKSMAASCMRYDFDHLACHPASAYASGDFKIVYVTDQDGCIGGRCVVYTNHITGTPQAGPIYGVSEQAIDIIEAEVCRMGAVLFGDSPDWVGARLKRIPTRDGDSFIAPYLDVDPKLLSDSGTYLVVSGHGEIDASQYEGVLGGYDYHCHECGEGIYSDYSFYSEETNETYCEDCFNNTHTFCEREGEHVLNENTTNVWISGFGGRYCTELVSTYWLENFGYDEFVLCDNVEQYWDIELTAFVECEQIFISPKEMEQDYFQSDWDGEWYPNSVMCTTADDEVVAKSELNDDWQLNSDGKWEKVQEEMEI